MTYVITLRGFLPPPRYDQEPWTGARVEESVSAAGPWAALETITLTPDADPSAPARRDLTTALATISARGWYRVSFLDAAANESSPTEPIQNDDPLSDGFPVPSVDDVADLMRARTKNVVGEEGTFTAGTRPTADDVRRLIEFVAGEVQGHVGSALPGILHLQARQCTMLGTAAMIELSYFPEQQNQGGADRTAAAAWREMYETALGRLASSRKSYVAAASAGGGQGLGAMRVKTQATLDREAAEAAAAAP